MATTVSSALFAVFVVVAGHRHLPRSVFLIDWLGALLLSVALVLGEFTIANLFSRKNLQVAMFELGKSDGQLSIAVGLASLVFAFVVLFAMSFVGRKEKS